mgnify:FL=1
MKINLAVFQNWAEKSFTNIDMHRIGQIVTGLSSSVLGVLEFIKNWLIGLIVMVYLLNIKDTLAAQGKKIVYGCLNLRQANLVIEELRFINQMFGGFIIGKLVDSLIIGIICFIGVTILNMPFPMLLSVRPSGVAIHSLSGRTFLSSEYSATITKSSRSSRSTCGSDQTLASISRQLTQPCPV